MTPPALAPFTLRHAPHALIVGATAGSLLALAIALPVRPAVAVAVALAGCAGVAIRRGQPQAAVALLLLVFLVVGWGWGTARLAATEPSAVAAPDTVVAIVDVDAAPRVSRRGFRVLVRVVALGAMTPGTRLIGEIAELPVGGAGYGYRLRVVGRVAPAATDDSPGWWRAYLERNAIAGRLAVRTVRVVGRRGGVRGLRDRVRNAASAAAGRGLEGDRREIVRGLALGAGEGLSEPATEAFRDAGLWHLLAVSGQNIGVVASAVFLMLSAFGLTRRRSVVVAVGLVVVYCLACDGGASVARAGIVGSLGLVGQLRSRRRDRWYLLLLGLAVLVLHQPRAIHDPGLQLSFAAVVGIFIVGAPFAEWLGGFVPSRIAQLVAQSLGATLATAPVVVAHFGELSLSGLVVNLIAVPLAGPLVVVALVGVIADAVVPAAGSVCAALAGVGADVLLLLARAAAAVPGATVSLPAWSAAVLAALVVAVPWSAARLWRRDGGLIARPLGPVRVACAISVVATAAAIAVPDGPRPAPWPSGPAVTALDVGQGDAILLRSPDGSTVLIDTGPPGEPAPIVGALRRVGVRRLNALVITHHQLDHDGAVIPVLAAFDVDAFLTPVAVPAAEAVAADEGTVVRRVAAGDVIHAGGWRLDVLWPVADFTPPEDPNDASLVVRARAPAMTALLPGDAESNVLSRLPLQRVDLLKVSHHGSEDAGLEGLLARLRPRVAVISAGARNRFGHPRSETLESLNAAGVSVYRTDRVGSTTVAAGPGGTEITTERAP